MAEVCVSDGVTDATLHFLHCTGHVDNLPSDTFVMFPYCPWIAGLHLYCYLMLVDWCWYWYKVYKIGIHFYI